MTCYTLRLNTTRWYALRKGAGLTTDTATAAAMGVDRLTVMRVQNGRTTPSPRFIAGALAALGYPPGGIGADPRCLFVIEADG